MSVEWGSVGMNAEMRRKEIVGDKRVEVRYRERGMVRPD